MRRKRRFKLKMPKGMPKEIYNTIILASVWVMFHMFFSFLYDAGHLTTQNMGGITLNNLLIINIFIWLFVYIMTVLIKS